MPGFDEILGQEPLKAYMKKALTQGYVSHAYLLSGEKGMGKKTLAKAFAAALLCDEGGGEACGKCHSCIQFAGGNHPDAAWVTHEKTVISVDDIRGQLVNPMQIRPYSSRYKIYFVDEAELMTVQAQNALLKTIEEPPEYGVVMLLTANPDTLLPTVRSRCTKLKMTPLPDGQIRRRLIQNGVPEQEADVCTAFARGNLGRAEELSRSEEFASGRQAMVGVLTRVRRMTLAEIMAFIRGLKDYGLDNSRMLDFCELWYRDILCRMSCREQTGLIFAGQEAEIAALAEESSYRGIERVLREIERARARLTANVNFETAAELLLYTMKTQEEEPAKGGRTVER